MSLYRNVLSRAWKTTWHNKYLWFFGLFAAFLGNGGEYEVISRGLFGARQELFPGLNRLSETGFFSMQTLSNFGNLMVTEPLSMISLFFVWLLILVIFCFLVWLVIVSQGAVVNNTALSLDNKKANFQDGLKAGINKFWPVFGLNILLKIIIAVILIIITVPIVLSTGNSALLNLIYGALFIIFIPIAMSISFILKYAIAYVVIRGYKFNEALIAAWKLFKNNWLVSLETAVILFFINFAVGILGIILLLVLAVPFIFLAMLFGKLVSLALFWIVVFAAVVLFIVIIILLGATLATFQISVWTTLFVELVSKGGVSKIVRIFNKD